MPTVKGTEVSLSCVHGFLYLVPSSINVSIFHVMWLYTFWTDLTRHLYVSNTLEPDGSISSLKISFDE